VATRVMQVEWVGREENGDEHQAAAAAAATTRTTSKDSTLREIGALLLLRCCCRAPLPRNSTSWRVPTTRAAHSQTNSVCSLLDDMPVMCRAVSWVIVCYQQEYFKRVVFLPRFGGYRIQYKPHEGRRKQM